MKMIRTTICLLAGFLFSVSALAAPDLTSLRTSKHSNDQSSKMVRSASYVKTDVHVFNNSSQMITVKVPGTSINDTVYPGEVDDILSDVYFDAVEVVLYDEEGYEFFRDYVPNHATIEVRNIFGARTSGAGKQGTKVQAIIKK